MHVNQQYFNQFIREQDHPLRTQLSQNETYFHPQFEQDDLHILALLDATQMIVTCFKNVTGFSLHVLKETCRTCKLRLVIVSPYEVTISDHMFNCFPLQDCIVHHRKYSRHTANLMLNNNQSSNRRTCNVKTGETIHTLLKNKKVRL